MNDADSRVKAGSKALPFNGMIEKSVTVIERNVDWMRRLAKRSDALWRNFVPLRTASPIEAFPKSKAHMVPS
jgi:hypothetical protein